MTAAASTSTSPAPAAGALTFVFTDIEGSTRLWEQAPEEMKRALARHDELVRDVIDRHGGRVFATGGDGVAAVFARAVDGVAAAAAIQQQLAGEPWPDAAPIRVRVGVHTGEVDERDGDYFGTTLNRTARLMAIAHGGQSVCSTATVALLGDAGAPAPLVDLGQHRLRDLSAPVGVFQVGEGLFPPLRSLDSVPSNLPTILTDLVGRTDDIRTLAAELRTHRLVTVTGVGGVGKTRLALAVGGTVAPDFVDGCWLVELAPVADGSEVVRTIASALGASVVAVADDDALRRYLEHRRLVVVLDNCEHVLDAAADAAELMLRAAPDVHVVATSREPLGVDGELVRRVRSLDDERSVSLFVERARAADGDFVLSDTNTEHVAEICRHLDGIPLAIELAAARVAVMAPAEIAQRLDDRFRVLTGGRRAQERHRTLQAAVGWSYDLLSPAEQVVFARLSVFPTSFDLPAALAVADTDDVDTVTGLVHRSLVVHDQTTGRYRLLETLRQFGADRLAELGESEAAQERYAAHYVGVVARHGPGMMDHRHDESVAVLSRELDHVRSTAEWLAKEQRWDELHRIAVDAIHLYSHFIAAEAAGWLELVLTRTQIPEVRDRVDALAAMAHLAGNAFRFDTMATYANEAIALARQHGVPESPYARYALTTSALYGDAPPDSVLEEFEAMLAAAAARGDEFGSIVATAQSATWLARAGRTAEAHARAADALSRATRLDNATVLGVAVLSAFSVVYFDTAPPDVDAARALMDRYGEAVTGAQGGTIFSWLATFRALVFADIRPRQAAAWAVGAVTAADRAGVAHAVVAALEAVTVACSHAGLRDEAAALASHLESLDDAFYFHMMETTRAMRRAAVAEAGATPEHAVALTRRELFDLLTRIEQAIAT